MTKSFRLLVVLALFAPLTLVGCASGGGGDVPPPPTPEEEIAALLDSVTSALAAQDVDAMMVYYSDDFASDTGQDKAATAEFLNTVKEQGFLEGIEIDTASQTVAIEGDTATVEGIGLSGAFGVLTLGFKLEKRDGEWVVVYQSQQ